MSKKYILGLLLLLTPILTWGQSTTLSGTVQDAGGQLWFAGSVVASFVPVQGTTSGQYTWTGGAFNPGLSITASINSSGFYTMSLPSTTALVPAGAKWTITANSGTTGLQTASVTISVTGGAQTQNFTPPVLSISAGPGAVAYVDSEVTGQVGQTYYQLNATAANGVNRVCQVATGTSCTAWTNAGGSSSISQGPIINVTNTAYSGCFATVTSGQDWSACFASVSAAANASAFVSQGGIVYKNHCEAQVTAATSASCNVAIAPGDTILAFVFTNHGGGQTVTIADSSAINAYIILNPVSSFGSTATRVFGSIPQVGNAATSVTVTDTPAEFITLNVVTYTGVGDYGTFNVSTTTATNTTPTATNLTWDNNNFFVSGVGWYSGGVDNLSANVGNLRSNLGATATLEGGAVIDNTTGSPANVTTSGTLSVSTVWTMAPIELRSGRPNIPAIYFPVGRYYYSSGLNLTQPASLIGVDGSSLCYTGTAHSIDIGPTNLTTNNYQFDPYTIEGLRFVCGGSMAHGIFINHLVDKVNIRHNTFMNFGNSVAYDIFANGETDDLLIEHNYWWAWNGVKNNAVSAIANTNTQLRFLGNVVDCVNGKQFAGGCTTAQAGIGVSIGGVASVISENNFNYLCPNVLVSTFDVRVVNNYMEGANTCAGLIEFSGVPNDALHVEQNYLNAGNQTNVVAPATGTDTIQNALVSHNYMVNMPLATALVKENNLTGQTGNLASMNMCAVTFGTASSPCPFTHTLGGNINQWNNDYSPVLTYAAATTASYTFTSTYNTAPKCVISPVTPGATTFTITTLNTTTLTVTASVAFTGTVNASCNPDAQ